MKSGLLITLFIVAFINAIIGTAQQWNVETQTGEFSMLVACFILIAGRFFENK